MSNLTPREQEDGYRTGSLILVQDTRNCHQISQSTYSLLPSRGQMGRKSQRTGEDTQQSRIRAQRGFSTAGSSSFLGEQYSVLLVPHGATLVGYSKTD